MGDLARGCPAPFFPRSLTSSVAGMVSAEMLDLSMTLLVYQGCKDRMYCCEIEKATTMRVCGREGVGGSVPFSSGIGKVQRGTACTYIPVR